MSKNVSVSLLKAFTIRVNEVSGRDAWLEIWINEVFDCDSLRRNLYNAMGNGVVIELKSNPKKWIGEKSSVYGPIRILKRKEADWLSIEAIVATTLRNFYSGRSLNFQRCSEYFD